jgi:hypothetical protein
MKLKQLMALAAIVTPSLSFAFTIDMGTPQYTYDGTVNYGVQLSAPSTDASTPQGVPETFALVLTDASPDASPITNPKTFTANIAGAPVPEPSTWALFLLGLAGVSLVAKRKVAVKANTSITEG